MLRFYIYFLSYCTLHVSEVRKTVVRYPKMGRTVPLRVDGPNSVS